MLRITCRRAACSVTRQHHIKIFTFHQMGLSTGGILPRNQFAGRNFEWAETLPPGCVEKLALYESMESWIYDACNLVQHVFFFGWIIYVFRGLWPCSTCKEQWAETEELRSHGKHSTSLLPFLAHVPRVICVLLFFCFLVSGIQCHCYFFFQPGLLSGCCPIPCVSLRTTELFKNVVCAAWVLQAWTEQFFIFLCIKGDRLEGP